MGSKVRGPGLRRLYGLKQLAVRIALNGEDIEDIGSSFLTDATIVHLAGLKQLRRIETLSSGITPQGKQKLRAALPDLKFDGGSQQ